MTLSTIARLSAFAIAVIGSVLLIGAGFTPDVQPDADAYWHAAQRLREGMPLYLPAGQDETEIYRYAPWFAFAWLPLTYLSQDAAFVVWRGLLLLAAVATVAPLLRRPSPASITLSVLVFSLLVSNLPAGNVTTLMVGALAIGLRTRAGPFLIGAAASLKVFPILLVAGYLAERRWREAAISVAVAAVLWLHVLVFGLSTYPTTTVGGESFYLGGVSLLAIHPALLVIGAAAFGLVGAWMVLRRSPW
ncbi:MAG TPA: glycosyltransferase 87 family protein, partial [Candidatus Limnocylindria bacterium]|nr:glycosyltransferase 87 family protein [Candidatus Limnocylindria bacterium]